VSDVPRQDLVATVARQNHLEVAPRGAGNNARGHGAGVLEGLAMMPDEIVEHLGRERRDRPTFNSKRDPEMRSCGASKRSLIVAPRLEPHRHGMDIGAHASGGACHGAGVDPATQEEAERDIRDEALLHALIEQIQ
jgi:hypothetical protein